MEIDRIKHLVSYYTRLCGTSDPFEIADRLGILYQIGNCKNAGCYMYLKKHRYIFLNQDLNYHSYPGSLGTCYRSIRILRKNSN